MVAAESRLMNALLDGLEMVNTPIGIVVFAELSCIL
jgi:hypothetical protein